MKTKEIPIVASQFGQVATVAVAVGVARTTLQSAAERGEVESRVLYGDVTIVSIESARAWAGDRPKRGRPPAKT